MTDKLKNIIGGIIGLPIGIILFPIFLILYLLIKDLEIYTKCDKDLKEMTALENIDYLSSKNLFI